MQTSGNPIAALRDVDGVIGSFLVDRDGRLTLKDLPRMFDDVLFEDVGPRVIRLGETLEANGKLPETVQLRFADHRIHLKFLRAGALVTLCELTTNPASLKMALALTARRVEHSPDAWHVEGRERITPTEPLSAPPVTQRSGMPSAASSSAMPEVERTSAAPEPEAKGRAAVMYRGRRIG
jgi:predicted regulator of Ras-like GTPase activity (Roadblock/LC7/MglB family)